MTKRSLTYDIGDVVEVGAIFRVAGALTTPTSATAYLEAPDGTVFNSDDNPTRVPVELGATTLTAQANARLATPLTAGELAAGTGIVRVRFVVNDHPKWNLVVVGQGDAQGAVETEIAVRRPAVAYRYDGNLVLT